MSGSSFTLGRTETDQADLVCKVISQGPDYPNQFSIENNHCRLYSFDKEYVCFSGYFGKHGPHVFAAAPELLEALHQYRSDLRYPPTPDSIDRRIAMIDSLIAKALPNNPS